MVCVFAVVCCVVLMLSVMNSDVQNTLKHHFVVSK